MMVHIPFTGPPDIQHQSVDFLHAVFVVCSGEEAMRNDTGSRGSLIEKNIENMAKGNKTKQYMTEHYHSQHI